MVDTNQLPAVLAAVAIVAAIVFAVGASALAAQYGGVWAALTVAGFLFGAVAVVLLYAFGEMEREERGRQERF